MYTSPRGTQDRIGQDLTVLRFIEKQARQIFKKYNYNEISTPIIEEEKLFMRSLGKTTEVVKKQMLTIKKSGETLVLRPEATAGVIRAYLENNLDKCGEFTKLFYIGQMYRGERPQKGRLREFYQFGVEAIGSSSPFIDAEVIALASQILDNINVCGYRIIINTLGCLNDKDKFAQILKKILSTKIKIFCPDCKRRIKENVFRVLDCKNETCKEAVRNLNINRKDYLCNDCQNHYESVKDNLKQIDIGFEEDICLVRGLDYYTKTVFEIKHASLGSQDTLGAGGRYDNLVQELGGKPTAAVGFAFGIERVILVSDIAEKIKDQEEKLRVFIACLGDNALKCGFKLLQNLRKNNINAEADLRQSSLKSQMRQANKLNARFVIIIGDNELEKGTVVLKNMASGEQKEIKKEELIGAIC
ncbi:MAG: histidine--tRNA ligase [Candidatus Omnitrophota bacterium]